MGKRHRRQPGLAVGMWKQVGDSDVYSMSWRRETRNDPGGSAGRRPPHHRNSGAVSPVRRASGAAPQIGCPTLTRMLRPISRVAILPASSSFSAAITAMRAGGDFVSNVSK
jgi:hypothetical protein